MGRIGCLRFPNSLQSEQKADCFFLGLWPRPFRDMNHSVLLSVHENFCHPVDCFLCYFVFNVNGKSVTSRSCAACDNSTLNNSSCESVMHQQSPHPCKNVRACQRIHKSSTIHMDALYDHMFHAFLSSLTLYCSAHLLISLRMPDDVLCSLSTGFSRRP